jgi:hypothetical protein
MSLVWKEGIAASAPGRQPTRSVPAVSIDVLSVRWTMLSLPYVVSSLC